MTLPIKYIVKSKPRTVKRIATIIIATGLLFLFIGNFIYTPFSTLPLELQAFAIAEILPDILFSFDFLSIIVLAIGFTLLLLKWRTGTINLNSSQLTVDGSLGLSIRLRDITNLDFFDSEYGAKRTIQIDACTDKVKLKFKTDAEFEGFSEKLIESVREFQNVKIKTWT